MSTVFDIEKLKTARQAVENDFLQSGGMCDALELAFTVGNNVLIYGPGGYGKSEIAELFVNAMGVTPFIFSFSDSTTETKMFGGMDYPHFKKTGEIKYVTENSFMNHEVVIFEEIFDAPTSCLLSLKDVMTSGKLRHGNDVTDCKTKVFIGLTNRSKEDVNTDDSIAALLERFHVTYRNVWGDHTNKAYDELFVKKVDAYDDHKDILKFVATIFAESAAKNATKTVSPRTAVRAALGCTTRFGLDSLQFLRELDSDVYEECKARFEQFKNEQQSSGEFEELRKKVLDKIQRMRDIKDDKNRTDKDREEYEEIRGQIEKVRTALIGAVVADMHADLAQTIVTACDSASRIKLDD